MKQCVTEERAFYEDNWHGQFSKKLAEWAIGKMRRKDFGTGEMKPVAKRSLEEVEKVLKEYGAVLPEKAKYTGWYLWHMALADYQNALPTDEVRAYFVYETVCDPDGCPANVLDCFVTKMRNAGETIFWDEVV